MKLQEAKMFIRNTNNFIEIFGEEIFERALANYDITDFSTFEYVIRGGRTDVYYARKGYPVICDKTTWSFKEYKDEWEREVQHLAREYRVPCRYQLREKDLLKDCILLVNPNMENYQMSIYHLDGTKEIYVQCDDNKSLYVPVKAIVDKDFSLVVHRHTTYHKGYYNIIDRKEYLDAALATLETKTAKALCKTIEEGEPYEPIMTQFRPRTIKVSFEIVLDGTSEAINKKVENKLRCSAFSNPTNIKIEEV